MTLFFFQVVTFSWKHKIQKLFKRKGNAAVNRSRLGLKVNGAKVAAVKDCLTCMYVLCKKRTVC